VVTQDNIATTICKTGWTKTVRPSTSVTGRIKKATIQAYGLPADTAGELDHLVSLQLGGAPEDTRNLWVEPGNIPNPKDTVESKLNAAICSGLIPLVVGQKTIASNWTTALDASGLTATGKVCLRSVPAQCVRGRHGDGD
jgi:hypothetical protein